MLFLSHHIIFRTLRNALAPRLLLAFALPLVVASCTRPPTVEALMAEAKAYEQKGDTKAAVIQLKNVLQRNNKNAEARYQLGLLYMQGGDVGSAEKEFREALNEKYDPVAVLPLLARCLFQQAQFEKLLEQTRSSDYGEPALQPEILGMRGHAQLSLGKNEDATESFAEALKRKPEFATALLGQARLAMQKQEIKPALSLVERALASDAKSVDGWLMKGDLERALGKPEEALIAYQRAWEISPRDISANINLASMHMLAGRLEPAKKNIETIRKAAPDSPIGYYLQALLEFRNKNYAAADVAVKQLIAKVPDYLPGNALAGAIAYSLGANAEAERRLQSSLERYPNNTYLRKLLAAVYLKQRSGQNAMEVLQPALKIAPDDPNVLSLAAEASLQNQNFSAAKNYYQQALKQDPRNARGYGQVLG